MKGVGAYYNENFFVDIYGDTRFINIQKNLN